MKLIAVTSCPTGIAHTYMAAEALEVAAREAGHEIQVESQGAGGAVRVSQADIDAADAVIFAADVEVRDKHRFAGKPTVVVGVKAAISDPGGLLLEAERVAAAHRADGAPRTATTATTPAAAPRPLGGSSVGSRVRQWLMTGVSYMIPFVAAGGIMIALGFMLARLAGGEDGAVTVTAIPVTDLIASFDPTSGTQWAALLFQGGVAAFGFLVAVLAGFIAYAIADRPGLAPGFVAGALSGVVGAGFLGGLVGGFLAGFLALGISRVRVPRAVASLMPVVVTPLLATIATTVIMLLVVGRPLASVQTGLTDGLNSLSGGSIAVLGAVLGLMMAFDMGGPVNKTAYVFATGGLTASAIADGSAALTVMAVVMAAGMTPPLGLALATVVRRRLFTDAERENGKAAWLLGASFITEGAIPFAAADPLRVIPSIMVGSGLTGALVALFGSELAAPHGGIWVTPLISGIPGYLLAIVVGTVVTAGLVIAAKSVRPSPAAVTAESDDVALVA
ncbi:PTS fructose transporter subunit IIC [Nocardioides sp. AX2bis]|uniref:PTS fructose transporter subunit IIC n=1 Tax=Nocardioides sp. AX2bis TaxID=2653157 RepID=UPI0012F26A25|nr:PTS fructose transporter subunit IIBC [Nocardioides sp. AX2bis]VXC03035.1 PTS system fructose-specific EIIB component / PTS system fructose-specific EIIC component [Nocardioides sp. AX2bis]